MIVVECKLQSSVDSSRNRSLCKMEIANIDDRGSRADYRVRLFSAGDKPRLIREVKVENWPKRQMPAWRLIQRAFVAIGPH